MHMKFGMSQPFGGGAFSCRDGDRFIEKTSSRFIDSQFAIEHVGDIDIDILRHRAAGSRRTADLDHRHERASHRGSTAGGEQEKMASCRGGVGHVLGIAYR